MAMKVNSLKKAIKGMQKGQVFYVNSINLTVNSIEYLRSCIKDGTISPVMDNLKRALIESAIPEYVDGTRILPQCNFIVN